MRRRTNMRRTSVHPAYARIAAHPAGAGRGLPLLRPRAVGMRRECGILLAHALLTAGWTIHVRRFGRAADQLLKLCIAILALILVDWHSYIIPSSSNIVYQERRAPRRTERPRCSSERKKRAWFRPCVQRSRRGN